MARGAKMPINITDRSSRLCLLLLIGFLAILMSATLHAQTSGTIAGVVQDDSTAAIPNVKVTVTNVDTGIVRSTVSDDGGRYEVAGLIPGNYEAQAELP